MYTKEQIEREELKIKAAKEKVKKMKKVYDATQKKADRKKREHEKFLLGGCVVKALGSGVLDTPEKQAAFTAYLQKWDRQILKEIGKAEASVSENMEPEKDYIKNDKTEMFY